MMLATLVFYLFLATKAHSGEVPDKYALILGGGDPSASTDGGQGTIFDDEVDILSHKLKEAHYHSIIRYDSGHPDSQSMVQRNFGNVNRPFTEANANLAIDEYIKLIQKGAIQRPAQILVAIDSHGAPSPNPGGVRVAGVEGSLFDLGSKLEALRDLAEQKGIRLALLDMSCFSGSSLTLGSPDHPNTCVITEAPDNQFGYLIFAKYFYMHFHEGTPLESAFLSTRSSNGYGFPEIGTEAGVAAMTELRSIHSQVVANAEDLEQATRQERYESQPNCLTGSQANLNERIEELYRILVSEYKTDPLLVRDLAQSLKRYLSAKQKLMDENRYLERLTISVGNLALPASLFVDLDQTRDDYNDLMNQRNIDPRIKQNIKRILALIPAMSQARSRQMKTDARFRGIIGARQPTDPRKFGLPNAELQQLAELGSDVTAKERDIYDQIYHALSEEGPNPCRDFKF